MLKSTNPKLERVFIFAWDAICVVLFVVMATRSVFQDKLSLAAFYALVTLFAVIMGVIDYKRLKQGR